MIYFGVYIFLYDQWSPFRQIYIYVVINKEAGGEPASDMEYFVFL